MPRTIESVVENRQAVPTMYRDGLYWTHSTFDPSVKNVGWRKIEIKDGFVRVIEPDHSQHAFNQPFFFDVNTMVGPAD